MNDRHTYYVYILASKKDGVLYTGMTNDLERRMHEHRNESIQGFTRRYHIKFVDGNILPCPVEN